MLPVYSLNLHTILDKCVSGYFYWL